MARNAPKGPGRKGSVRKRSQVLNPKTRRWTKRNQMSGRFVDVKQDGAPFKGVRKEHLHYRGRRG